MAGTSEVTLYTTPSSWGNERYGPLHAYDRVAGMMIDGETLWQDRSQISSENDYHPHDTDVTTYTLPTEFAKMLAIISTIFTPIRSAYISSPTLIRIGRIAVIATALVRQY